MLISGVMTSLHGASRPRYHGKLFILRRMLIGRRLMMYILQPRSRFHLLLIVMMALMMGR